jgi:hypothetical protein
VLELSLEQARLNPQPDASVSQSDAVRRPFFLLAIRAALQRREAASAKVISPKRRCQAACLLSSRLKRLKTALVPPLDWARI